MAPEREPQQDVAAQPDQGGGAAGGRTAKRARRASSVASEQPTAQLSAFEEERLARIAANRARLEALELPQLAGGLAALAPPKQQRPQRAQERGLSSSKRSRSEQPLEPVRRSARTRGEAPDPTMAAGIAAETRDRIVLAAPTAAQQHGSGHAGAGSAVAAAAPPGPLPFRSSNGDASSDAAFVALLAATSAGVAASEPPAQPARGAQLAQLQLAAADVAKMTQQGVTCVSFHPSLTRPIVAAADKSGKVSLWDVDAGGEDGGFDGVLQCAPHTDYVSSLKWLGCSGDALLSASYDGLVRRLDVASGVWQLVPGLSHEAAEHSWSAADATPDGSTVYLATSSGELSILDARSSSCSSSSVIASRKVNTLHLHSNGHHLASSDSSGGVAVFDTRHLDAVCSSGKAAKPLLHGGHSKSSQAAFWEPGGGARLLSISFDDSLRIWQSSGSALKQQLLIRHNNNTGRWVVPFRPAWSPAGDVVCVGDMKRGVALFDARSGAAAGWLAAEALTAIPSRLATHRAGLLAAATSSGRVHIFRQPEAEG